ncbi:stage II sporulation protein E [Alicyclobacillus shizuokensis]|uniref:stage II sporulation protein E n=1 Tax=Alicyclobacillus shizuokensis TaxID=392014 RepID=UPI0009F89744|nr:stage II sporulation protein E [Alicyclobacillus shizuokensis]
MSHQFVSAAGRPTVRPAKDGWRPLVLRLVEATLLTGLALLLGRASIGHAVYPFGLALYVVASEVLGTRRSLPAYAAIAGAYLGAGLNNALLVFVTYLVYRLLRKALYARRQSDLHWLPFIAGFVDTAVRLAATGGVWSRYDVFLAFAEGALVVILSLIFLQSLPVLWSHAGSGSHKLRQDQVVSLAILVGSVITGMSGISLGGISLVSVAVDWVVLTLAAAGGIGLGPAAAVVVGVLAMLDHAQTLAQVAVLAFAGLLAGTLRGAGRVWGAVAFVGSVSLLSLTFADRPSTFLAAVATAGVAAVLHLLSPAGLRRRIASYVPGTAEHQRSEQAHVRRVRALLSEKMNTVGQVFDELSVTFADPGGSEYVSARQLLDEAVGRAAKSVCSGCPRRAKCWEQEGYQTYQAIIRTVAKLEAARGPGTIPPEELRQRCIRLDSMMGVLRYNVELIDRDAKWLAKLHDQSRLVSAQMAGVAAVVRQMAERMETENETSLGGEERIMAALEQLGLYVNHVHIVSLESGKVEIEVTQPSQGAYENSVRMIAPLLSGILGEHIAVSEVRSDGSGPCTAVFTSARMYNVRTAVAAAPRDGRLVSGDTYTALDLGNGRFAIVVSDGMGNGERARRESRDATELLKKLLKAGFDEQMAIKTVNSTLLLRSREEMFTTLDMALIDLYSAHAEFLKIGSAPSFLRRGGEVRTISAANVPIGILQDIDVQTVDEQLSPGDILIFVSDGVYDAAQNLYDKEDWLKRQIEHLQTDDPQAIADTLLEAAVRVNHGQILDDMTVLVAVLEPHEPEWATIPAQGVVSLGELRRRGA